MNFPLLKEINNRDRFAIILASGDNGTLQPSEHRLTGDSSPKQYVRLLGDQSMLETTLRRAEKLVPPERQLIVVAARYLESPDVAEQLGQFPKVRIAAQPLNRGAGIDLLLALAHLYRLQPRATVALLPSDHLFDDENLFQSHVEAACRLVDWQEKKIVLLGVTPNAPETEYGYILARNQWHIAFPFDAREVSRLVERPHPILARKLILQGGYWNTMVLAFKIRTLLEHVRVVAPTAYHGFVRIYDAVGGPNFSTTVRQVYAQMPDLSLSTGILDPLAARREHPLLVLPVRGVHWMDRRTEARMKQRFDHAGETKIVLA